MQQYKDLLQKVVLQGKHKTNRTGIDTIGIIGAHMKFNMNDGFPAATTKKVYWKAAVSEMLAFLRGYDNASDFRKLGCKVWDQNANENKTWLDNPNRKGEDDLGRVYGVQARDYRGLNAYGDPSMRVDQLRMVYDDLKQGIDNRREIVTHWNPGEMDQMALPPCHLLYQFGIQGKELHLSMYQRSCDMGLGVPFNIVGYSWLLCVMAKITGLHAGTFNHFLHDVHIYENHLEGVHEMLNRKPLPLPTFYMNPDIKTLEDLETWVTVEDFELINYECHPPISMEMAV